MVALTDLPLSKAPKELHEYSAEELLNLIQQSASGANSDVGAPFSMAELVERYITISKPNLGWFDMDMPIAKLMATVLFEEPNLEIEDYSNLRELSKGVMHAAYSKAISDCAAMFGVTNADSFYFLVLDFIDRNNCGTHQTAKAEFEVPALLAAIEANKG